MKTTSRSDPSELPAELREWESQGKYVDVGLLGHRLFVRSVGSADASPDSTLLLLHGYPESSFVFGANLAALGRRFERIVLFDFLGFGLSDKPFDHWYSIFEHADMALDVWRQVGVKGGHLLAHDMGDSVATELLARQVGKLLPSWFDAGFASVTFTNGNMVMELANLRLGQRLLRTPYLGAMIDKRSSYSIFAKQVRSASGTQLLPEREIELMAAASEYNGGNRIPHKLVRYLDERDRFQDTRWLPAVAAAEVPIHFCWGASDAVAPRAVAEHLQRQVRPEARLTMLPGVGHFCQQEAPSQWNEAVLQFWQDLPA